MSFKEWWALSLYETTIMIVLILSVYSMGWYGHILWNSSGPEINIEGVNISYQGLYLNNYGTSKTKVLDKAYSYDEDGDWVCINVDKMNFSRGIEVCQHECGHAVYSEIYAEKCEKNWSACLI